MPRVSIIVPNYNHVRYVRRRIESILTQTYQDWELILLDDASTDGSTEILREYAAHHRVRLELRPRNSGSPFIQWNHGVRLAQGTYVWLAESDDFAAPDFLESMVPRLDANPACTLAYCESWRVDAASKVLGTMAEVWDPVLNHAEWEKDFVRDGKEECAVRQIWKNTVPNASAALFRRDAYLAGGGAPEDMRLCGDWLAWARVIRQGDVAYAAAPMNYFRQHHASVRSQTSWKQFLRERWITQAEILGTCPVPAPIRRCLAKQVTHEVLDQVLPARPGTRWSTAAECLRAARPLLQRYPGAVFQVAWQRSTRRMNRT